MAILDLERKYHLVLMVRSLLAYPILGVGSRESGVGRVGVGEWELECFSPLLPCLPCPPCHNFEF
ncbi:hypothetical protein H6G17_10500 [Chroococcidiopsis sp. FACHB-1243]|uniref:hypothetical protein n=1 Tax=Chroococcidiopsis sp. [FACHB-1243] TaxID=2692781 RepID=UPI001785AF1F|nr:hypothetical protein [Chroococcidiopsis sp. [FACHB-1243]]MBD2305941.1 hypothetical protein [Chroococcidiopsis sp. [FACHB-1243]]